MTGLRATGRMKACERESAPRPRHKVSNGTSRGPEHQREAERHYPAEFVVGHAEHRRGRDRLHLRDADEAEALVAIGRQKENKPDRNQCDEGANADHCHVKHGHALPIRLSLAA